MTAKTKNNCFSKAERLSGKTTIDLLYKTGKNFNITPFKVIWLDVEPGFENGLPAKLLISVPQHRFKKAVDRNRIKRRIREAYRKNKHAFYQTLLSANRNCIFVISFNSNAMITYSETETKIILILQRLISSYEMAVK